MWPARRWEVTQRGTDGGRAKTGSSQLAMSRGYTPRTGTAPSSPIPFSASLLRLVAQSCLTLCDPTDCSPPGSFVHGDSPGKNTRVGCHPLLQGISPTQELNPDLPHCRQSLYCLSHQCSHQAGVFLHLFIQCPCCAWGYPKIWQLAIRSMLS